MGTYIKGTWTKNTCFARDAYVKGIIICNICGLAYILGKSFVRYSRLLVESTLKISLSCCLRLQVILYKVIYYHPTH